MCPSWHPICGRGVIPVHGWAHSVLLELTPPPTYIDREAQGIHSPVYLSESFVVDASEYALTSLCCIRWVDRHVVCYCCLSSGVVPLCQWSWLKEFAGMSQFSHVRLGKYVASPRQANKNRINLSYFRVFVFVGWGFLVTRFVIRFSPETVYGFFLSCCGVPSQCRRQCFSLCGAFAYVFFLISYNANR